MQLKNVAGAAFVAALAILGTAAAGAADADAVKAKAADTAKPAAAAAAADWAMNATVIEACSCPMFCQCYFNSKPASHGAHAGHAGDGHFCKANLAYRVNKGHYGKASLDGARFWVSNDLGGDFSMGQMDWAVLTFDKSLSAEQRAGIELK